MPIFFPIHLNNLTHCCYAQHNVNYKTNGLPVAITLPYLTHYHLPLICLMGHSTYFSYVLLKIHWHAIYLFNMSTGLFYC